MENHHWTEKRDQSSLSAGYLNIYVYFFPFNSNRIYYTLLTIHMFSHVLPVFHDIFCPIFFFYRKELSSIILFDHQVEWLLSIFICRWTRTKFTLFKCMSYPDYRPIFFFIEFFYVCTESDSSTLNTSSTFTARLCLKIKQCEAHLETIVHKSIFSFATVVSIELCETFHLLLKILFCLNFHRFSLSVLNSPSLVLADWRFHVFVELFRHCFRCSNLPAQLLQICNRLPFGRRQACVNFFQSTSTNFIWYTLQTILLNIYFSSCEPLGEKKSFNTQTGQQSFSHGQSRWYTGIQLDNSIWPLVLKCCFHCVSIAMIISALSTRKVLLLTNLNRREKLSRCASCRHLNERKQI